MVKRAILAAVFVCVAAVSHAQTVVSVNGYVNAPPLVMPAASTVYVELTNDPGGAGDWVTLVPADAPNATYWQWFYLGGVHMAAFAFDLPAYDGDFEVRVFADNGYRRIGTSSQIAVRSQAATAYLPVAVCRLGCDRAAVGAGVELRDEWTPIVIRQYVNDEGMAAFTVAAQMFNAPYIIVYQPGEQHRVDVTFGTPVRVELNR